jgi:hypothetical protein
MLIGKALSQTLYCVTRAEGEEYDVGCFANCGGVTKIGPVQGVVVKPVYMLCACLVFAFLPAAAQNSATVKQAESACGSFQQNFRVSTSGKQPVVDPVGVGTARIYMIEVFENPTYKIGRGPTIRIGMDGRWVGADHRDSYLVFPVDMGEHHLCINWQSKFKTLSGLISLVNFTAEPGHAYYFRARITARNTSVGAPWYTLDLEPVNSDEAKLLLAQRLQGTSTTEK